MPMIIWWLIGFLCCWCCSNCESATALQQGTVGRADKFAGKLLFNSSFATPFFFFAARHLLQRIHLIRLRGHSWETNFDCIFL
jgi:hypothetical protein